MTVPGSTVSEPASSTCTSKEASSASRASSTATPRTSGTSAFGRPEETTTPIGPGRRASSPGLGVGGDDDAVRDVPRLLQPDRGPEAEPPEGEHRLGARQALELGHDRPGGATADPHAHHEVVAGDARPGGRSLPEHVAHRHRLGVRPAGDLERRLGRTIRVGRLGDRRAGVGHGEPGHAGHLHDRVGVRNRRAHERERTGERHEPGGHDRPPAAPATTRAMGAGNGQRQGRPHGGQRQGARLAGVTAAGAARRGPGAGVGRATERLEHLGRRGSRDRIPREQPGDERGRRRGSIRHDVRERGCVLVRAAQADREPVVALERRPAGEQREQDAAERVQVGGGLAVGAACLLGRPVLGGAEQHPACGHARGGAGEARQPEVGDDDASSRRLDQHVRGRQVAMDDAAFVRVGERRTRSAAPAPVPPPTRASGPGRAPRGWSPPRAPSRGTASLRPRRSRTGAPRARARAGPAPAPRARSGCAGRHPPRSTGAAA